MVRKLPIVTMRVGVSVEDSDDPSRKVTTASSNPRERKWIDLPLDSDCLLQVELKRRTLDRAKVSCQHQSLGGGSLMVVMKLRISMHNILYYVKIFTRRIFSVLC